MNITILISGLLPLIVRSTKHGVDMLLNRFVWSILSRLKESLAFRVCNVKRHRGEAIQQKQAHKLIY
jgi:hypothetical protein